jgi:DtxR family transcriptional regulator, Mn-dependent transcriptional regulator
VTDQSNLPQNKRFGSVENFLKAVYSLQEDERRVSTNALAELLGITAPSVTDMARRLVASGFIDHEPYKGVLLTSAGREAALKVLRRHRLIELYLVRELGYELQEVHDEAENLEHAVSDRFVEALATKLGDPSLDPHGDPIPSADGYIANRELQPLSSWPVHTSASVSRIKAQDNEMLQHILDRGFRLDSEVEVLARDPFDGPITARVDGEERIIGHQVAECILLEAREDDGS